jgi:hypothetical protein
MKVMTPNVKNSRKIFKKESIDSKELGKSLVKIIKNLKIAKLLRSWTI